jgi:acetyl esterase/lipase
MTRRNAMPTVSEDILNLPPPPADARLSYGFDSHQFGDLRVPKSKGPHPVLMNIHGGFWRNRYDLSHAGHLCAALTEQGVATWNLEYRRVGDEGGGWPGTFEDLRQAYRFIPQLAQKYGIEANRVVVMGHSAGGQLALCLAAHESSVHAVISLAGVVDLRRAWELHLSNNAVGEFLGGPAEKVPEHYREADPMQVEIKGAQQWVIHGSADDVVPPDFSRRYAEAKNKAGENVHSVEIENAGHFDLIDPRTDAWKRISATVVGAFSGT